jgi:YNFM family putative membrane transporter
LCGAGSFAVFSSIFNYLPFRLAGPPFLLSTQLTTMLYLVYVLGIFIGPVAGRISNRFGSGRTLLAGAAVIGAALAALLLPMIAAVVTGLLMLCGGFFTVHVAAVGALNRRIAGGQGRANALYVLFYYIGGWLGITLSGLVYEHGGWGAVIAACGLYAVIPAVAGIWEINA